MIMSVKELADAQLVILLREGNLRAYEVIYQRYWYKLYLWASHQIGAQDAEELVQEVFLSLWNRRAEIEIKRLDLYLAVSIKNQVYSFFKSQLNYRKYQEYLVFKELEQAPDGNQILNFKELTLAIEEALNRLPEKSAEVFRRSRYENQPIKEIAKQLNLSEKAVEYHLTKSLKYLKNTLKPYQSEN
ncbi:MAG: sigma-70 family RNA polymerase sigma factor [Saprospiraceae bacterium]|nr:sigma-70 family RNA polymerase sigma factor [Saprospiraceae bacterium]